MTLLVISVLVVLLVSAACSVSEAALYAVWRTYVRQIAEQGSRAGTFLLRFKDNMEQPISAILIVNTVANTAGAAVAGAQAHVLFGDAALIWFSLAFTLCVLFSLKSCPRSWASLIAVRFRELSPCHGRPESQCCFPSSG